MARLWWVPGGAVMTLVVLGPLLSRLEWVPPERGFGLYLAGTAFAALLALVFGGAGALGAALGRAWRGPAVRASVVPLLVFVIGLAPSWSRTRWPFHEVSTDLENPPPFVTGPAAQAALPDGVRSAQMELFPNLKPIRLDTPAAGAFRRVEETARAMPGWEVSHVDASGGLLQAVALSRVFRFRDDVVIRVGGEGSGSRVDVRSRSRVGQSDLGANAERIEAFESALLSR